MSFFAIVAIPLIAVHFTRNPTAFIYIPSVLPTEWQKSRFTLFVLGILHVQMITTIVTGLIIANTFTFIYGGIVGSPYLLLPGIFKKLTLMTIIQIIPATSMPLLTKEFRTNQQTYRTFDFIRHPYILSRVYRTLEVTHKLVMSVDDYVLSPLNISISMYVTYVIYTLIRHSHSLVFLRKLRLSLYSLLYGMSWIAFLGVSGLFHTYSEETIDSWKYYKQRRDYGNGNKANKYMIVFQKSCRPLAVGSIGHFTIHRLTVLEYLRTISTSTLRAMLLAFRS